MEAQVQKMKEAFESAAAEMGGRAEVDIAVMYPGFKYQDGDQVVEVAKKRRQKSAGRANFRQAAAEVTQTSLPATAFRQSTCQ